MVAWPDSQKLRAPAILAGGVAVLMAQLLAHPRARHGSRRKTASARKVICAREDVAPVDFYGLLGLPRFCSDPKQIKKAHRRVVKLVHPDILQGPSDALQRLVMEAYEVLMNPVQRSEYNRALMCFKSRLGRSVWSADTPPSCRSKAVWVDPTVCKGCMECLDIASSTFEMEDGPWGEKFSHVTVQYADSPDIIEMAMRECPEEAIKYVRANDVGMLEHASAACFEVKRKMLKNMQYTVEDFANIKPPSPWELMNQYKFDYMEEIDPEEEYDGIIEWDYGEILESDNAMGHPEAEKLSHKAKEIYNAAGDLPIETRYDLWPSLYVDVDA